MKTIAELLQAWQDGELSDDEVRQLDALLSTPEGRAQLVQELHDRAVIVEALRARSVALATAMEESEEGAHASEVAPNPSPPSPVVRTAWKRRARWVAAACFLVGIVSLAVYSLSRTTAPALEADLMVLHDEVEDVRIERGGASFGVSKMASLQSGDIIRIGPASAARIVYRQEATWVELAGETDRKSVV